MENWSIRVFKITILCISINSARNSGIHVIYWKVGNVWHNSVFKLGILKAFLCYPFKKMLSEKLFSAKSNQNIVKHFRTVLCCTMIKNFQAPDKENGMLNDIFWEMLHWIPVWQSCLHPAMQLFAHLIPSKVYIWPQEKVLVHSINLKSLSFDSSEQTKSCMVGPCPACQSWPKSRQFRKKMTENSD